MLLSFYKENQIECGVDEAGRGALAGPVCAAAVILPSDFTHDFLTDSKKLSAKKRYELREIILEKAISWAVSFVSHTVIDKINILQATYDAMHDAIKKLDKKPDFLLIDGNRFRPYPNIPHECIVKGDGTYLSIAAASILAKTFRDDKMKELHQKHPEYSWDKNMGYGTKKHVETIINIGKSPYHRQSFHINRQAKLPLEF